MSKNPELGRPIRYGLPPEKWCVFQFPPGVRGFPHERGATTNDNIGQPKENRDTWRTATGPFAKQTETEALTKAASYSMAIVEAL